MPDGETVAGARLRRPARRGVRGGWRVRRAKARESGDHLTALGAGAPDGPCRIGRQTLVYDRRCLLAVRDKLDREAAHGVAQTIRSSLPARLSCLIRRSCHSNQSANTNATQLQRTLIYPVRLTEQQTLRKYAAAVDAKKPTNPTYKSVPEVNVKERDCDQAIQKSRVNMSLELLNVQSLLPKLPDIRADVCDRSPEMLCYTETNLKSTTPNRLAIIQGYQLFRQDRKTGRKKSGGGVAIYVKEHLSASKITIKPSTSNSHLEALWVKVKIDNKKVATVACVYRPPSSMRSQIDADFIDLEDQIQQIITAYPSHRIIIAGDMNADPQTNPTANIRLLELERYGLNCVVNEPTFYRNSTRSILDVVLLSNSLYNDRSPDICSVHESEYVSHHRRVCVEVQVPRAKQSAQYRTGRKWRSFDSNVFLNDVRNIQWHEIVKQNETCEQQWAAFSDTLNTLLNFHAPIRKFRVHNPKPPPVSHETKNLMKQRRRAKAMKDPAYSEINTITKRAIRKDCRSDIANRVNNSTSSSLFQQLEHVIAPKRGPTKAPENLSPDDLNEYFTSIGINTRNAVEAEFERSGKGKLLPRLPRVNAGSMRLTPITLTELKRILFSLPNKSSSLEDDLPITILKLSFDVIGRYLLRIINTSLVTETVPSAWKRAAVIPLFKRDDPSKASNFRPITKVPGICKVVEKIVHSQLTNYLQTQNLINEDQHGFMPQHSTCTALLTMTDEILKGMDQSQITLLVLIDLSRCFDVIDHQTLLNKLDLMQISTGWFKSYLQGHVQQVKIGENFSKPLPITIGTFQGTCLGPLLFNVVSNDLACHIPAEINGFKVSTVRYADDTQISVTGPKEKLSELQRSMEELLKTMCTWFQQHGMKVNAAKTEFIMFGDNRQLKRIEQPPVLTFMGEQIQCSKNVRNLGVFMDETLSWDHHIKTITDRCFGILIGLSHVKHILPIELLPRIVDCLVMSHVRYCVQVYGSASVTSIKKIQRIFNFAARVISGRRKYDHISQVLHELGWPKAEEFVQHSDLRMIGKIIRSGKPSSLASLIHFNREILQRNTRQANHIALPLPRNNHGKRTFLYRASKSYNDRLTSGTTST